MLHVNKWLSWLQIGAFFLINLCLVVIATQFSETKKREMARMLAERKRFQTSSSSTLASSSEPGGCYDELIKYASHVGRKVRRRLQRLARRMARNHRRRRVTPERAAVAVSLRRRRRRHEGRTRRRAEAARHHPASQLLTPATRPVTATPPSPSRRSPVSPRSEHRHAASTEPGPVLQVPRQPGPEHPHPLLLQQQQQQQQHESAARRPDFLRMPSHDSVGYASIVSVLSWSSLPTPSVYVASPPLHAPADTNRCIDAQESVESDSVTATRYLVLPLELISIDAQSRRASSASAYMQDFCCLSSEQLVVERHPTVSAVDRVRGSVLRSESLGSEPHQSPAPTAASSRHRGNRASSFAGEDLPSSSLTHPVKTVGQSGNVVSGQMEPSTAKQSVNDCGRSTTVDRLSDTSPLPSNLRRNSVNRASSLSSATTPRTKSNFLAVPDPVIGAGPRRASVIRARSLGNDDQVSCIAVAPETAAARQDTAACPPVTTCDWTLRRVLQ